MNLNSVVSLFSPAFVFLSLALAIPLQQETDKGALPYATVNEDHIETIRILREGEEAEKRGDFGAAFQGYQRLFDTYDGQVVGLNDHVFLNSKELCRWRILRHGDKGRETYRTLFDAAVGERFLQAAKSRDVARLESIADRYTFSSFGFPALDLLVRLSLEKGDASRALYYFTKMDRYFSRDHSLNDRLSLSLARALHSLALQGRTAELQQWTERFQSLFMGKTIPFQGRERKTEEFLQDVMILCEKTEEERKGESKGATKAEVFKPGEKMASRALQWKFSWAHDLFTPIKRKVPDDEPFQTSPLFNPVLPLFPAVSGNAVYLLTPGRVSALDLNTGKVLWYRSLASERGREEKEEWETDRPVKTPGPAFVSVGEGKVFVLNSFLNEKSGWRETELLALSLDPDEQGKVLWKRGGSRDTQPFFRKIVLAGRPVVFGGRVCVGGFELDQDMNTEPRAYLFIFQASNGVLVKKIFLCSAPALTAIRSFDDYLDSAGKLFSETIPALENGILYFCTNLGALAAVDILQGEPLWVFRYERAGTPGFLGRIYRTQLWFISNVIVEKGKIYVTPCDSPYLHILFPYPEKSLGAIRNYREDKENGEVEFFYLLGVHRGVVYLAGNELGGLGSEIWALEHDGVVKKLRWRFRLSENLYGMGTVHTPYLLVPSTKYLYQIDTEQGAVQTRILPGYRGGEQDFGNVISLGKIILTSSLSQVSAFVPKEDT